MNLKPGLRLAGYVRISTNQQNNFHQIKAIEEVAKKNQCNLIEIYSDEKSAFKKPLEERDGMMNLLNDAREKKFDVLLVYQRDRLSRITKELARLRILFSDLNIKVLFCAAGSMRVMGNNVLIETVQDGVTAMEAHSISIRTFDSLKAKIEKDEDIGMALPYGCDRNEGKIIVRSHCVDTIKQIFNWYKCGYGYSKITKMLNEGIYDNRKWTKYEVQGIVPNPIYKGFTGWGKRTPGSNSTYKRIGDWAVFKRNQNIIPILSEAEWDKSYEMYTKRKNRITAPNVLSNNYLVKGILKCHCDTQMKTRDQRNKYKDKNGNVKVYGKCYYYCPKCGLKNKVSSEVVDKKVWDLLCSKYSSVTKDQMIKGFTNALEIKIKRMQDQMMQNDKELLELGNKLDQIRKKIADYQEKNKIVALAFDDKRIDIEDGINSIKQKKMDAEKELNCLENEQIEPKYWCQFIYNMEIKTFEKGFWIRNLVSEIVFTEDRMIKIIFKYNLNEEIADPRQTNLNFY